MIPIPDIAQAGPQVQAGHEVSIARDPDSVPGQVTEVDAVCAGRCRRIVHTALGHWGQTALADTAVLMASELVTNALRHAPGPDIGFRVFLRGGELVIEVRDGSPNRPVLRNASLDDETGRGLLLVNAMASAWGTSPDGATTWCTLPLAKGPQMEPLAAPAPVNSTLTSGSVTP